MNWIFEIAIERDGKDFVVTARDLPEVLTAGESLEEALLLAQDAVETAVAHRMDRGLDLAPPPAPAPNAHTITLGAKQAAKAGVYVIWKRAGISKSELARRMSLKESEARRILSPHYATKIEALESAAKVMGSRLMVSFA